MAIPWLQLVKHAPALLSLSREVLQRTRQTVPAAATEESHQIQALAADLQRQAEVLHAVAAQVEALTAAAGSLRRTLVLAVSLGAIAMAAAVAALVIALSG